MPSRGATYRNGLPLSARWAALGFTAWTVRQNSHSEWAKSEGERWDEARKVDLTVSAIETTTPGTKHVIAKITNMGRFDIFYVRLAMSGPDQEPITFTFDRVVMKDPYTGTIPSNEPWGETGHDGWWVTVLFEDWAGGTWSLNGNKELDRKSYPRRFQLRHRRDVKHTTLRDLYPMAYVDQAEGEAHSD